jgi:hypothetical protein
MVKQGWVIFGTFGPASVGESRRCGIRPANFLFKTIEEAISKIIVLPSI